ncbi:MAG TPA: helix-turn-helix domain-containing protein [Solirubrobacterales bacterium]|nr:helix-turn-helix domain-containing protein [Solirubrobacterales bacterium]
MRADFNIFPNGMTESRIQNPEELGARIRRRRTDLRLTQEELAAVSMVTPRLLGEVERGKKTTQLDGLLRILAALGLDLYLQKR